MCNNLCTPLAALEALAIAIAFIELLHLFCDLYCSRFRPWTLGPLITKFPRQQANCLIQVHTIPHFAEKFTSNKSTDKMADPDYYESDSDAEVKPGKKQRKSQAGRKLMRWNREFARVERQQMTDQTA